MPVENPPATGTFAGDMSSYLAFAVFDPAIAGTEYRRLQIVYNGNNYYDLLTASQCVVLYQLDPDNPPAFTLYDVGANGQLSPAKVSIGPQPVQDAFSPVGDNAGGVGTTTGAPAGVLDGLGNPIPGVIPAGTINLTGSGVNTICKNLRFIQD